MNWLVSATTDLAFHKIANGEFTPNISKYQSKNRERGFSSVSWKNDGTQLVVVQNRGFTEIIDFRDDICLSSTLSQIHLPNCATFHNRSNDEIAVGTLSGQIYLYNIRKDYTRQPFLTSPSSIFQLKYNNDDTHLVVACSNGDILLYGNSSSEVLLSFRVPKSNSVSAVCFDQISSNILSAGSKEGEVVVWDIDNNSVLYSYSAHRASVSCIAFSPTISNLLVSSDLDQKVLFHDIRTNKRVSNIVVENSVTTFDISHCGNCIGLGTNNGNILLYDNRNLNRPAVTFSNQENKKIRHLLFQKGEILNTYFKTPCKQLHNQRSIVSKSSEKPRTPLHEEFNDSFLTALKDSSLYRTLEDDSSHEESTEKNIEVTVVSCLSRSTIVTKSSTPSISVKNSHLYSLFSPILNTTAPETVCSLQDELKTAIREILREELKTFMAECRNELSNWREEILYEFGKSALSLQFDLARRTVKMREALNKKLAKND